MIDILAIAAHPDDVELAAAGTLIRHIQEGYTVAIADLTRGELGTRGNAALRLQEAENSRQILGVEYRVNLGLPDGFFHEDDESLRKLVEVIRHFRPRIVLANAISDRHPDHARGASFASRACFLAGLRKIETSYGGHAQQAWRPAAVYHFIQDHYIKPDLVVDITPHYQQKIEAIMAFRSQFFDPDSKEPETPISSEGFLKFLEARARDFGRLIGCEYAEAFTVERPIGVPDLVNLV